MPEANNQPPQNLPTTSQALGELIIRTFGPMANRLGQSLPNFPAWSLENLGSIINNVKNYIEENKIENLKPIPERQMYMFLNLASQEDDERIQDLWAGLIANAIDPSKNQDIDRHLINLISQLDPVDAQIIQHISDMELPEGETVEISTDDLINTYQIDFRKFRFSILNMVRLGMLADYSILVANSSNTQNDKKVVIKSDDFGDFDSTPILFYLIEACKK